MVRRDGQSWPVVASGDQAWTKIGANRVGWYLAMGGHGLVVDLVK